MKSSWLRILLACTFSASIWSGSRYWANLHRAKRIATGESPIAFILNPKNQVQRRSASRLIWQPLASGDEVFSGESVRTGASSGVRVRLADGNQFIDLEEESLIILNASRKDIEMDLLSGSAFVDAKPNLAADASTTAPKKAPTLTLNTQQGKVDLSKATASFSKSKAGLDLQIVKGKATTHEGAEVKPVTKIQINSPYLDKPNIVDTNVGEVLLFSWSGLANQSAELWIGRTRQTLKPSGKTTITSPASVKVRVANGRQFFRIISENFESPVFRFEVQAPALKPIALNPTPTVIPKPEVTIRWNPAILNQVQYFVGQPQLEFSWVTTHPEIVSKYIVKVENGTGAESKTATSTSPLAKVQLKEEGDYLVQVEALDEKNRRIALSDKTTFVAKVRPLLRAPAFVPASGELIADPKGNITLIWSGVDEAKDYKVSLVDKAGQAQAVDALSTSSASFKNMNPGTYIAEISAVDSYGRPSQKLQPRRVVVPTKNGLAGPKLKKVEVK